MAQLKNKVKNTLDEARILILGSQVLLGFEFRGVLEPGFEQLSEYSKYFTLVGLGLMLLALALLVWPGTYHQLVAKGEDTDDVHNFASIVLGVAILPFALGLGTDFFVAGEVLYGRALGLVAGLTAILIALVFWYGLECIERHRHSTEIRKEQQVSKQQEKENGRTELKDKIQQVLTEVRVALPGAQTLLGFQLTALLMGSFGNLPQSLKTIHFISLALVGLAIILFMTPAAYHRIVEQGEETERFHHFAGAVLLTALVPLALGITGDFYLVARIVTGSAALSIALAVFALLIFYGLWFGFTFGKRYWIRRNAES